MNALSRKDFEKIAYNYTKDLWRKEIRMYKEILKKEYGQGKSESSKVEIKTSKSKGKDRGVYPQEFIEIFARAIADNYDQSIAEDVGCVSGDLSDLSIKIFDFSDFLIKFLKTNPSKKEKLANIIMELRTISHEMRFHAADLEKRLGKIADVLYGEDDK